MEKKAPYWVDAKTVMRLTGWNATQMMWQRRKNPQIWKPEGTRYIYDLNKIPKELLKTADASL